MKRSIFGAQAARRIRANPEASHVRVSAKARDGTAKASETGLKLIAIATLEISDQDCLRSTIHLQAKQLHRKQFLLEAQA